jgi:NHL repeat
MITHHIKSRLPFALLACILTTLAATAPAQAAEAPVKLILSGHLGWEVNLLTKGYFCKTECQRAGASSEPGGFDEPEGVAVAPSGNVYVVDQSNYRVQEFNSNGEFVVMFGKEVNAATKGDVCTASEVNSLTVKCEKGAQGEVAGAFALPHSIVVEPAGTEEDIYVEDVGDWSIDKYKPDGTFVMRIGKEVNETKDNTLGASEAEKNICTAASHDICKGAVQGEPEGSEPDAFYFGSVGGDQLAIGPAPEHLLYVGDHHRIQRIDAAGESRGSFPLPEAIVSPEPGGGIVAIAVNSSTVYLAYGEPAQTVYQLDANTGNELPGSINVPDVRAITAMAVDSDGHIAIVDRSSEERSTGTKLRIAYIYKTSDDSLVSSSVIPVEANVRGISFGEGGNLYAVSEAGEGLSYVLSSVGEFVTGHGVCSPAPEHETSAAFACSLSGEVNPYNIPDTEALFEWGKTCLFGASTPRQSLQTVKAPLPVNAVLEGVRPNESLCFRFAGYDQNAQPPEVLAGEPASLTTESVPPKVLGTPSVSFVTSSSADLSGELNPENTNTTYEFQYAKACNANETCSPIAQIPGMLETPVQESAAYGRLGTTAEISGLQPQSTYRYRLTAANEKGEEAVSESGSSTLPEGTFTTGQAPATAASTGAASAVGATSATISGSVNPDGLPATYSFELGVYEGATTQYGDVFSGPAGTAATATEETLALTGLQPDTTYAYRIAVHSGYIHNSNNTIEGATVLFTTAGVPTVIEVPASLAQLAIPAIAFPKEVATTTTTTPKALTKAQQLANALKTCRKDKQKNKRTGCERVARKKYAPTARKKAEKK